MSESWRTCCLGINLWRTSFCKWFHSVCNDFKNVEVGENRNYRTSHKSDHKHLKVYHSNTTHSLTTYFPPNGVNGNCGDDSNPSSHCEYKTNNMYKHSVDPRPLHSSMDLVVVFAYGESVWIYFVERSCEQKISKLHNVWEKVDVLTNFWINAFVMREQIAVVARRPAWFVSSILQGTHMSLQDTPLNVWEVIISRRLVKGSETYFD